MKFNKLVPELSVFNFKRSLDFYTRVLGFDIAYDRPEEGFAFLLLGEAQIMIDEIGISRTWETAEFSYPLGRGINLQIEVDTIDPILENLDQNNIPLFLDVEEKWYRVDKYEFRNKQFLVQDPDGYLLRFPQDLGARSL